jgi:hypothetical protein
MKKLLLILAFLFLCVGASSQVMKSAAFYSTADTLTKKTSFKVMNVIMQTDSANKQKQLLNKNFDDNVSQLKRQIMKADSLVKRRKSGINQHPF